MAKFTFNVTIEAPSAEDARTLLYGDETPCATCGHVRWQHQVDSGEDYDFCDLCWHGTGNAMHKFRTTGAVVDVERAECVEHEYKHFVDECPGIDK